jgi:uncharacterized protein YjaZ
MTSHRLTIVTATAVLLISAGCAPGTVAVEYRNGDGHTFSRAERRAIDAVAARAVRDARELLPALPAELRLTVQTGRRVIPETGETGEIGLPGGVYWTVDPAHDGGVIAVVNAQLRATLLHELYHLVREARFASFSLIDRAIGEGLATAFERDHGGAATPWGEYTSEVSGWTEEFLTLPDDAPRSAWMSRHPDGRRWIGYKVGTYLADRAVRVSGLSLAQLATVPTATIVEWGSQPNPGR